MATAIALCLSDSAGAATIVVDGSGCTLRYGLTAANTDQATGGCTAGSGADRLALTAPVYTLDAVDNTVQGPNGLPVIAIDRDHAGDHRAGRAAERQPDLFGRDDVAP